MANSNRIKEKKLEDLLGLEMSFEQFYSKDRTQAERIIYKFCGARELYRIFKALKISIAPSTIYKWGYSWDKGGTGGVIPGKHWENIQKAAKYAGIILTIDDYDPRKMKYKRSHSAAGVAKRIYAAK